MSRLIATIVGIESVDSINIVRFICEGEELRMVSLALSDRVQVGKRAMLAFKPTSLSIAKLSSELDDLCSVLSYSNQLKVVINSIEHGKLLSNVKLKLGQFELEAIVSSDAVKRLDLKEDMPVLALMKANELSLLEVLND